MCHSSAILMPAMEQDSGRPLNLQYFNSSTDNKGEREKLEATSPFNFRWQCRAHWGLEQVCGSSLVTSNHETRWFQKPVGRIPPPMKLFGENRLGAIMLPN